MYELLYASMGVKDAVKVARTIQEERDRRDAIKFDASRCVVTSEHLVIIVSYRVQLLIKCFE